MRWDRGNNWTFGAHFTTFTSVIHTTLNLSKTPFSSGFCEDTTNIPGISDPYALGHSSAL